MVKSYVEIFKTMSNFQNLYKNIIILVQQKSNIMNQKRSGY